MPSLLINQGTNSAVMFEDAGGTAFRQSVAVDHGTITITNPIGTTIQFNNGTVNLLGAGTITKLEGGTVQTNLLTGTLTSLTDLANLAKGTITKLEGGTVQTNLLTGTLTSMPNVPGGTLALVTRVGNLGTLEAGTITTMPNVPGGTLALVTTVTTVSNITNGSIKVTAGTEVVTSGSINVIAGTVSAGTINTGTINTGTVVAQANPLPAVNVVLHAGTSGTLGIGTLVAASAIGVGTALYPTNFRIIVISGTLEVILAFGSQTNGNQVIHHGLYPAGGGIANPIVYPHGYGTTNSPLTYQILSGAGTASWDTDYFLHT